MVAMEHFLTELAVEFKANEDFVVGSDAVGGGKLAIDAMLAEVGSFEVSLLGHAGMMEHAASITSLAAATSLASSMLSRTLDRNIGRSERRRRSRRFVRAWNLSSKPGTRESFFDWWLNWNDCCLRSHHWSRRSAVRRVAWWIDRKVPLFGERGFGFGFWTE